MKNFKKVFAILLALAMAFTLVACEEGVPYADTQITQENRVSLIEDLKINLWETNLVKGEIPAREEEMEEEYFSYELPDINNYEIDVKGDGEIDVEIFLPLENNGSSIRELVSYVAQNFNSEKTKNSDDKTMSVTIRSMDSSLAEDFVQFGAYMPKGYIASNELYGLLMQANGINVRKVASKLVGNTMGIAIEKETYDKLVFQYGNVSIATIVTANMDGNLSIGYTNPTNNPTGLNFVVSMLAHFDENNPYSIEATTDFSNFQNTVSSVAYSTEQMVKAVDRGTINAFVIEHQAYKNDEIIENNFVFMPFGVRHDYPLYSLGNTTEAENEVLESFAKYFQSESVQKYADTLNFNQDSSYVSTVDAAKYPLGMVTEILSFWKENKASGKQIVAIFVADISGSMNGKKLDALKESLKNAMQYVSEDAMVGLMSFEDRVYYNLPVGKFETEQQEYFVGAVDSLKAGGGTATNNAILMALKVMDEEAKNSSAEIQPIIILLSDGYTCRGYSLSKVKPLIEAFDVPIYTIGYEADVKELEKIANINGGVFINASTDDVGYAIKTLFNAEI